MSAKSMIRKVMTASLVATLLTPLSIAAADQNKNTGQNPAQAELKKKVEEQQSRRHTKRVLGGEAKPDESITGSMGVTTGKGAMKHPVILFFEKSSGASSGSALQSNKVTVDKSDVEKTIEEMKSQGWEFKKKQDLTN